MADDDPTKRFRTVASILLVSDAVEHIEACQTVAEQLGVYLKHCQLDAVAHAAAEWRPFALLVSEALHRAAPPSSLEHVATSGHATLVLLKAGLREEELLGFLRGRLNQLLQQHFA